LDQVAVFLSFCWHPRESSTFGFRSGIPAARPDFRRHLSLSREQPLLKPVKLESNGVIVMWRLGTALLALILSGGLALAQGGGSSGGSGGSGSSGGAAGSASSGAGTSNSAAQGAGRSGTGNSATPGAQTNGPNNSAGPVPGLSTPSASDNATVGRAPGVNPGNPQDARRRGNPSDRNLRGAQNPQDMKPLDNGVPQIIKPER
jgi:hypothetical protein